MPYGRLARVQEGSPERGKLPMSRDRKWFVDVFCGGTDPVMIINNESFPLEPDQSVWGFVGNYNQYDPLNIIAAVPDLRDKFYDPVIHNVRGVDHRVIGLNKTKTGVKDRSLVLILFLIWKFTPWVRSGGRPRTLWRMTWTRNCLQDLSVILNAHQDIDDALQGTPGMGVKEMQELFAKVKAANDRIGVAVMKHLPG